MAIPSGMSAVQFNRFYSPSPPAPGWRKELLLPQLIFALGLLLVATPVGAAPIQGPVRGVVEVADGAQVGDIVVHLGCRTHGIHSSSWPADDVTRIVASGESFLIPWAYRGLSPAGCSLSVYHSRYVVARRPLDDRFSQQFGLIRQVSLVVFLTGGRL